jgi:hypothetical protein
MMLVQQLPLKNGDLAGKSLCRRREKRTMREADA